MKLSLITINRNNAAGLEKTLQSVASQTFKEFEYVIVDGASTDGSVEVIKKYVDSASEALACQTPVVAFQCTGIQEVVDHKVDGYLAEPYDSGDLAQGILWCLENNAGNRLGMAGREKVLKEYTFDAVCGKYKELYESV